MKKIKWYYWFLILLIVLFVIWQSGVLNNYLPFFITTDGWNKAERKINTENILLEIVGNKEKNKEEWMNWGWQAQVLGISINQKNVSVDIHLDEGDQSFEGILDRTWQENYDSNFQYRGDIFDPLNDKNSDTKKNVILYFEKKSCDGSDGYVYNYTAELNLNGEKKYTGCAKLTGEILNKKEPEPVVVKDFEGEASADVMKLNMKEWFWIKTQYNDDTIIKPNKENTFSLKFENNKVSIKTDCNNMFGGYSTKDKNLIFQDIASTMMYCEGSQENQFSKMLGEVSSYMFTSKGELILLLKYDSGSMIFW